MFANVFFHPDYTVGTGLTPVQSKVSFRVADYTADREFHPALKNSVQKYFIFLTWNVTRNNFFRMFITKFACKL